MGLKEYLKKLRKKLAEEEITLDNINDATSVVEDDTINDEMSLQKEYENDKCSFLEKKAKIFFSGDGRWYSFCFNRPEEHCHGYLPCHLDNDTWLAHTFKKSQKLHFIPYEIILEFVKTSNVFAEEKHAYAMRVVKWQIEWMLNGGEGWILPKDSDDLIMLCPNCDIGFREGVLLTLKKIGMSQEIIEEGIERNANIWRDRLMKRAFNNEFNGILYMYDIEAPDIDHRDAWIKLRKYEYYQEHKDQVDMYGEATPEMQMSDTEVMQLREYLTVKNQERLDYLEECKKDPQKKKKFTYFTA